MNVFQKKVKKLYILYIAQRILNEEIRNLEKHLVEIDSKRDSMNHLGQAVQVPIDLLEHLDRKEQCNPHFYTRHKIDFCAEEKERFSRVKTDFETIRSEIDKLLE